MDVQWGSLSEVAVASLGITVVVVVLFSLGVAAWARAGGGARPGTFRGGPERAAAAAATLCFASCLAAAAYGINLIVPG